MDFHGDILCPSLFWKCEYVCGQTPTQNEARSRIGFDPVPSEKLCFSVRAYEF